MTLNRDLVDALLDREDLGPEGLDLAADLMREEPVPSGYPFDAEALADVLNAVSGILAGVHVATCEIVLNQALGNLLQSWVPVFIWFDGPAGERPTMRGGMETTMRAAWRARLIELLGERNAGAFLRWIHAQRLNLEREVARGNENAGADPRV